MRKVVQKKKLDPKSTRIEWITEYEFFRKGEKLWEKSLISLSYGPSILLKREKRGCPGGRRG